MFEFTGKVIDIREKSGNSDRGPWKVWECVVEYDTSGQYPQRVVLTTRKEDIYNTMLYCQQYKVDVHATTSIDAREHNGSWFNSIVAYRAEACQQQGYQPQPQQFQPQFQQQPIPSGAPQQGNGYAPGYAPNQNWGNGNMGNGNPPF